MNKQTITSLGAVKSVSIKIDKPFKCNFDNLAMNNLNLITGMNGLGKSFLNKFVWAGSLIANMLLRLRQNGHVFDKNNLTLEKSIAQYVLDSTYTNNDTNGELTIEFEDSNNILNFIDLDLKDGKIDGMGFMFDKLVTSPGSPIYMSTETRLFSDIDKYLTFRSIINIDDFKLISPDKMEKLQRIYRLYDIMYIERLLDKIESLSQDQLNKFNEHVTELQDKHIPIQAFKIDFTNNQILYSNDNTSFKSLSQLGAGDQAIINMSLGTIL